MDLGSMAKKSETDPNGALADAGGTYKDVELPDIMPLLPQVSLPKGVDPKPFAVVSAGAGQRE